MKKLEIYKWFTICLSAICLFLLVIAANNNFNSIIQIRLKSFESIINFYLLFCLINILIFSKSYKVKWIFLCLLSIILIALGLVGKIEHWPNYRLFIWSGIISLIIFYTIRYLKKRVKQTSCHLKLILLFTVCLPLLTNSTIFAKSALGGFINYISIINIFVIHVLLLQQNINIKKE